MKATTRIYFADTYAFVEILNGNPNYQAYSESVWLTSVYNLMELYYHHLRAHGEKTADTYLKIYFNIVVPVTTVSIQRAMKFKVQHRKEKLSYVDCLGYAIAEELDIPFLTGDVKFENKENVEYVK